MGGKLRNMALEIPILTNPPELRVEHPALPHGGRLRTDSKCQAYAVKYTVRCK